MVNPGIYSKTLFDSELFSYIHCKFPVPDFSASSQETSFKLFSFKFTGMTSKKKAADVAADDDESRSCSGLKLSTFWPDSAEIWFAQTDAQFEIKHISSSRAKFYHAVAALPQDVAEQVLDLIRSPPKDNPYSTADPLSPVVQVERVSTFRVPSLSLSLRGPETLSPDESDACPLSGRFQA